ncbi:MAG: AraC family transcriptional regulator [Myxococcales bacterium]|nr:AraC family transcriptional regulator [Myxococcales bacterium]
MSLPEHSVPAIHGLHLAEIVERWGVEPDALLRSVGLRREAMLEPGARLRLPELIGLVERSRALTGEPGLGFHVGLHMRIASHGYLGLAAMTSTTVREALDVAIRFAPTRTTAISLRLDVDERHAALVLVENTDLGSARDAFVFALLTGIWKIGDALTGIALAEHGDASLRPSADVAFAEPPYFARFASVAPHVRFDQSEHRLVFPRSLLDLRLVTGDPVASRLTLEQCERELEALGLGPRLSHRVRGLLGHASPPPSLEELAKSLHVSPRTLKRHLASEGTTYRALLDEALRTRAEDLLRRPSLTLDDIAERLGYSDVANFNRAFKRWTGRTPGAFRREDGAS